MNKFKRYFKNVVAMSTVTAMLFTPFTVKAEDNLNIDEAAYEIGYFMQLINEYYIVEDFTLEELTNAAIKGVSTLLDNYSEYYSENELSDLMKAMNNVNLGLGISILAQEDGTLLIKSVTKGSPAWEAGIQVGDVVTKVNGVVSSKDLIASILQNDAVKTIKLDVVRGEETLVITAEKADYTQESVYMFELDEIYSLPKETASTSHIRYVEISSFTSNTGEHFADVVDEMKEDDVTHLILDLRNNTGGQIESSSEVCKELIPEGLIYTLTDKKGESYSDYSTLTELPFECVYVLVNGGTASAAELVASAIQDSGAGVVIGTVTYGKGIAQTIESSLNGGGLKYTFAEYFTRDGHKVNGIGITPDVVLDVPEYIYDLPVLDSKQKHPDVLNVKTILTLLGFNITDTTDFYDNHTKDVIKEFQYKVNLYPTGLLDMDTIMQLNSALLDVILKNDVVLEEAINLALE